MKARMVVWGVCVAVALGMAVDAGAQAPRKKTVAKAAAAPARAVAGRASIPAVARDPYLGAIVVDADTGKVLFEDGADRPGYPASVIKLMNLLVLQERLENGQLSLSNRVTITAEAARIGGSQVYLAEKEVFSVEDLIYALMIQSANDAATALALHVGGTTAGFVELMNRKAAELGMTNSHFYSCHGLPPSAGGTPDTSTARDLALLGRELVNKHPDILKYTSTRERGFRNGQFIMRTHDHLLAEVEGCDGLKTGYFTAGGFSIVATARRGGRRAICVVLGSTSREGRDAKAKELLARGFLDMPPLPPPAVAAVTNTGTPPAVTNVAPVMPAQAPRPWIKWLLGVGVGALCVAAVAAAVMWLLNRRQDGAL